MPANPPRRIMRLARSSGGNIERAVTRFDHGRNCRVLELTVTWPNLTGYDDAGDLVHDGAPIDGSPSA